MTRLHACVIATLLVCSATGHAAYSPQHSAFEDQKTASGTITENLALSCLPHEEERGISLWCVEKKSSSGPESSIGRFFYNRARYLSTDTGRFSRMDEWGGKRCTPLTLHKYMYGNADPINSIDPTGLYSLSEFSAAVNTYVSIASHAFINYGRVAGGHAVRRLGQVVEEGVERIIKSCLKPNARIRRSQRIKRDSDGAGAVIDFLLEIDGKMRFLEVNYHIPATPSSGAFKRAAKQTQAMVDSGFEASFFAFKKNKGRVDKLKKSLDGPGDIQIAEGLANLPGLVSEFVLEACIQ